MDGWMDGWINVLFSFIPFAYVRERNSIRGGEREETETGQNVDKRRKKQKEKQKQKQKQKQKRPSNPSPTFGSFTLCAISVPTVSLTTATISTSVHPLSFSAAVSSAHTTYGLVFSMNQFICLFIHLV